MRWELLFADLESQLEHGLALEQAAVRTEEQRARLARVGLRERLRALQDAGATELRLRLIDGTALRLTPQNMGRDWIAGELSPDAACVLPLSAVASLSLAPDAARDSATAVAASLAVAAAAAPGPAASDPRNAARPAPPVRLADRIGLAVVLRDFARRRAPLELSVLAAGGSERVHGTIDRVGADHLDLAVHELGQARREQLLREVRVVAFTALLTVVLR